MGGRRRDLPPPSLYTYGKNDCRVCATHSRLPTMCSGFRWNTPAQDILGKKKGRVHVPLAKSRRLRNLEKTLSATSFDLKNLKSLRLTADIGGPCLLSPAPPNSPFPQIPSPPGGGRSGPLPSLSRPFSFSFLNGRPPPRPPPSLSLHLREKNDCRGNACIRPPTQQ